MPLTSQWTRITLTNSDQDMIHFEVDKDDSDMIQITLRDEEFWIYKHEASELIEALTKLSEN